MKLKKYNKVELYYPIENLPEDGWFQRCIYCDTITSEIIKVKTKNTCTEIIDFDFYICSPCKSTVHKEKISKKCKILIDKYLSDDY